MIVFLAEYAQTLKNVQWQWWCQHQNLGGGGQKGERNIFRRVKKNGIFYAETVKFRIILTHGGQGQEVF